MTQKLQQIFCLMVGALFLLGTANLNAQDTTATVSVTFQVDMSQAIDSSHFDPAVHSVWVAGSFNGWDNSGTVDIMDDADGDKIFSITLNVTPEVHEYKFIASTVVEDVLWENNVSSDIANREVEVVDSDTTLPSVPFNYDFNDLSASQNVDLELVFAVDMTVPVQDGDFDPTADAVGVTGSFLAWSTDFETPGVILLEDIGENVYQASVRLTDKIVPAEIEYKYLYEDFSAGGVTWEVVSDDTLANRSAELTAEGEEIEPGVFLNIIDGGDDPPYFGDEEPFTPVDPEMITSLADARQLVDQDTSVYVEFVVTSPDYGYNNAQFYGQDSTGGMYFFIPDDGGEVNGPAVEPGQVVQAFGSLITYGGFVEFIPEDGEVVGTTEIPDPIYLNPSDLTTDSPYLGMRVVVDMVDIEGDNWPRTPILMGGGIAVPALADSVADFDISIDRGQSFYDGHPKPFDGFTLAGNLHVMGEENPRVQIAPFFDGDIVGDFEQPVNLNFPLTFEDDVQWDQVFTDFDGGIASVVDNPDLTGINESAKVLELIKGNGQPWAGSFIYMPQTIQTSEGFAITLDVLAPRPDTKMTLKIENENDLGIFVEEEKIIPESGTWTELTFNLSEVDPDVDYHKIVFIFENGTVGDGSADYTWHVDNLRYDTLDTSNDVLVTFAVDMTDALNAGLFDPAEDVVTVLGTFNDWQTDFSWTLNDRGNNVYAGDYFISNQYIPENYEYKYIFWDNSEESVTWEDGLNRAFETTMDDGTDENGAYITYVHTVDNPAFFNIQEQLDSYIELYTGGVGGFAGEELMIPVYADFFEASTSSMEFEIANFAELGTFTGVYTDSTTLLDTYGWTTMTNFVDDTLFVASAGADAITTDGVLFYIGVEVATDIAQGEYYLDMLWAAIDEDAPFYFNYYSEPVYISVPMLGDVSMNGDVRAYDASLVLKWLVDYIPLSDAQMLNGDVTEDGELTALDASYILEQVVGLVEFPITDTPEPTGIAEFGNPLLKNSAAATTVDVPVMVRDLENVKSLTGTINLGTEWYTNAEFIWSDDFKKFQREFKFTNGDLKFAAAGPLTAIADGSIGTLRITVESTEMLKNQSVNIAKLRWNEAGTQQAVSNVDLDLLITSVETEALPTEFTLGQNYPNPFNPSTTINFALPQNSDVQIVVYDMLGKAVATLVNKNHTAGQHTVNFNASQLSSGIYFYQIKAGSFIETKKMTLIK